MLAEKLTMEFIFEALVIAENICGHILALYLLTALGNLTVRHCFDSFTPFGKKCFTPRLDSCHERLDLRHTVIEGMGVSSSSQRPP